MVKRTAQMEREANQFAMELLMPESILRKDIGVDGVDLFDTRAVKKLANKYRVPVEAMALRLGQLSLSQKEGSE